MVLSTPQWFVEALKVFSNLLNSRKPDFIILLYWHDNLKQH